MRGLIRIFLYRESSMYRESCRDIKDLYFGRTSFKTGVIGKKKGKMAKTISQRMLHVMLIQEK